VSLTGHARFEIIQQLGDTVDIGLLVVNLVERACEAHGIAGIIALVLCFLAEV
jgi:hypothetical protein